MSLLQIIDKKIIPATSKLGSVAVTITRYFFSYRRVACYGEIDSFEKCSSPVRHSTCIKGPACRDSHCNTIGLVLV